MSAIRSQSGPPAFLPEFLWCWYNYSRVPIVLLLFCFFLLQSCASTGSVVDAPRSVEEVLKRSEEVGYRLNKREPASLTQPTFQQPLRKIRISSKFGRRHRRVHEGVDLVAPMGTPIYAAAAGEVVYAGDSIQGYGDSIIVRHAGDYATLYAHASELRVAEGEEVERGQCIGYSGESGDTTGPHLHFEIRKSGVALNPAGIALPSRKQNK